VKIDCRFSAHVSSRILPSRILHYCVGGVSIFGFWLVMLPAEAAKLQNWQFNNAQNQLTFTTDEPVQPRVQVLSDPMRVVIDLPNTSLDRRREREDGEGAIDKIEVRRQDDDAQIVIELDNDYGVDPTRVVVQGTSATGWIVQLPQPQSLSRTERRASRDRAAVSVEVSPYVDAATIQAITLEGMQLTLRADRPLTNVTGGWNQATATYQITIPKAQLARGVTSPTLDGQSPLLGVRVRQESTSVIVSVQPAPGVQIGSLNPINQTLALNLTGQAQRRFVPPALLQPLPSLDQLPNVAQKRVVIAIDPGHGGRDPGAVGIGGLRETDIVLAVSLRVAELLRQQGAEVVLTRQTEREVDLEPRVSTANRANADLFLSVHANAIDLSRPDVNGVETYFYSSSASEELASVIQASMLDATGMNSRGVKEARFYVLRQTAMPAALVELGFVTGAEDAPRLADSEFRELLAKAVARGLLHYITESL
jgi:N-acetylmuramoyl-L-alanine amidase